jgi:hypothetical protein
MTREYANKIKKILRKENAIFTSTAGYYDGKELRVKVAEFLNRSYLDYFVKMDKKDEKEVRNRIIKVLRALEKNGLRPEYKIEQRESSNAIGAWDCRYIIFK